MKNILALFITILLVLPLSAQNTNSKKPSIVQIMAGLNIPQEKANNLFELAGNHRQSVTGKANFTKKLDSTINETFHTNWESESKEIYRYDANGRVMEISVNEPNPGVGSWRETSFLYNSAGQVKEENEYHWDGPGTPITYRLKYNFTYSGSNLVERTSENQSPNFPQWTPNSKTSFSYNSTGKEIEEIWYFWNSGTQQWEPQHKTTNAYDNNDNLIESSGTKWNKNTLQWENHNSRHEYFYDSANQLVSENYFVWNPISAQWYQGRKGEYKYTAGRISEFSQFEWNEHVADWVLSSKVEVAYDANGNYTEILMGEWDDNQWIQFKLQAVYDQNVTLSEVAYYPNAFQWKVEMSNKLVSTHYSAFYQGQWIDLERTAYHYSDFTGTGISSAVKSNTNLYPNPAKDHITFDLPETAGETEVVIMDMNGRVVLEQNLNAQNNEVKVNELSKGIYLYKLIGNEVNTGKFVVEF